MQATALSRRALFAATPALALAIAPGGHDAPTAHPTGWAEFIDQMRRLHPSGEKVARKALRAGVDLRDFAHAHVSVERNPPEHYPILAFREGAQMRYFSASDRPGFEGMI